MAAVLALVWVACTLHVIKNFKYCIRFSCTVNIVTKNPTSTFTINMHMCSDKFLLLDYDPYWTSGHVCIAYFIKGHNTVVYYSMAEIFDLIKLLIGFIIRYCNLVQYYKYWPVIVYIVCSPSPEPSFLVNNSLCMCVTWTSFPNN